tara:strand:+ start:24 stop:677 length:654 start_codon:yes stop_codon:yes gene_type:complete
MKKIILSLVSVMFLISTASAEIGVNIGVSGTMGLFAATGSEEQTGEKTDKHQDTEIGAGGWGSVFLEKEIGRFAIGVDFVSDVFSTDTVETQMTDKRTENSDAATSGVNKVQVDFEDLATLYATFNVTDNLYVKAGMSTIEVITNESLNTGSAYGNTTLDGSSIGFGYNMDMDNGLFVRAEGNYMSFDGVSLTSADNTIKLKNLDGVTGTISVGKSF